MSASNGEAERYIGAGTETVDLGGRLVLPGFIDSHCHPAYGAAHELFDIMFTGLNSLDEYKKAIRDFAAKHPDAKFIKGRGWKNTLFAKTGPDKKVIDEIIPNIPVALDDEGGHATWVNSLTLKLAGITRKTKNPRGGVIERDPRTGEASRHAARGRRPSGLGVVPRLHASSSSCRPWNPIRRWPPRSASPPPTTARSMSTAMISMPTRTWKERTAWPCASALRFSSIPPRGSSRWKR